MYVLMERGGGKALKSTIQRPHVFHTRSARVHVV
uniref:Uncharacterized protein n=1 Tax=Anguilla anguilla TaxID=7936 RepID=A0A0E9QZ11_ANGAN